MLGSQSRKRSSGSRKSSCPGGSTLWRSWSLLGREPRPKRLNPQRHRSSGSRKSSCPGGRRGNCKRRTRGLRRTKLGSLGAGKLRVWWKMKTDLFSSTYPCLNKTSSSRGSKANLLSSRRHGVRSVPQADSGNRMQGGMEQKNSRLGARSLERPRDRPHHRLVYAGPPRRVSFATLTQSSSRPAVTSRMTFRISS